MTIGNDLDEQFIRIAQRLANLEDNQNEFAVNEDIKAVRHDVGEINHEVGMAATYASLKKLEDEVNDRITDVEECIERMDASISDFDPDDLRCDFESQIEELQDSISYESDRIDEVEAYKITEEEVEDLVDRKLDDRAHEIRDCLEDDLMDRATELVHHEINAQVDARIAELEARLNRSTLGARVLRWLREGPSIKETATGWYAGIRRGR